MQVVRAAVDIPSGQELSLSYLGPQLFAPAAVRQQELQQQWEFHCSCNRCGKLVGLATQTAKSVRVVVCVVRVICELCDLIDLCDLTSLTDLIDMRNL